MKKLILYGVVLTMASSLLFGYTIISQKSDGTDVSYLIKCSNGKTIGFNKRISDGAYFIYGNIVYSLDKAVEIGCNK